MDIFKKISKTFITFLLTLMLIFQSVISSFVGATTSFAGNEQNLATITIENTENGTLLFEKTRSKSITNKKGSNIMVLVKPNFGYDTKSIKMETSDKKVLDLPVHEGKANIPVIRDGKISANFTKSNSEPAQVDEEAKQDDFSSSIEKEKKENEKADKEDKRDKSTKDSIEDSKIIAEILLKSDRTKVGQGTSVVAKDIVTVANTVINMRKTKARNLDELWKDRDGDGISDDWMAVEGQFDSIIPLYEVDENANYYVAKPNLAKIENSQLLQYIIADSNRSGTLLKTVIYEKESGLLYVPKNILYPCDIKDKENKKNIARLGRTRIQFLLGINDEIDKTKTDVEVKIDKNDSVKGDVVVSGKASINTMSDDTKIVLAKDNESKRSIKANSIDEIRVNGHEVNLNDVTYYEKEGVLELPLKPAQADSIEIKMSNSLMKEITNTIGSLTSFIKPLISFAGEPSRKIKKVIYFTSTPRKGDWWRLRGDNNTRNVDKNGARFPQPGYEVTYATNTYSDSQPRIKATVKMILTNQFSQADADRISREMGNENGTNFYTRNSYVSAQTATGSGNADMIIKQGFGLSLHCADAGVTDNFVWNPSYINAGARSDHEGVMVRLLDTDGRSWALFAVVSPSQSSQAGYGFFGATIDVDTKIPPDIPPDIGGGKYGFQVKKVDDGTGEALSGATFKVTQLLTWGESAPTQYKSTGDSGVLTFDGLPAGTYEIEEVGPPTGYKKIDSTQTIKLPDEDGYRVTFRNVRKDILPPPPVRPPKKGDYAILVTKTDGYTNTPITGYVTSTAKFRVTDPDGNIVWANKYPNSSMANAYLADESSYNRDFELDSSTGSFGILGLTKKGTYKVEEVDAPSGYNKSFTTQTVSVSDSQEIGSLSFPNFRTPTPEPPTPEPEPKETKLILDKKDEESRSPIEGAVFKLYKHYNGRKTEIEVASIGDGEYIEGSLDIYGRLKAPYMTTNARGQISVKIKDAGSDYKYSFEEVSPADGYSMPYNPETDKDWVVEGSYENFEMTNKKKNKETPPPSSGTTKILFSKKDSRTGNAIPESKRYYAEFELIDPNGNVVHLRENRKVTKSEYNFTFPYKVEESKYTVDNYSNNTKIRLSNGITTEINGISKPGRYKIREIKPPAGYKKANYPVDFEISRTDIDLDLMKFIEMNNEPDTPIDLTIRKIDSTNKELIKNNSAKFKLEDSEGNRVVFKEISEGNYVVDYEADYPQTEMKLGKDGTIKISGLYQNGMYKLTELEQPSGYELSSSPLTFNVKQKQNTISFENKPTPKPQDGIIRVHKVDTYNESNKLKGVVFELLDSNKRTIRVKETNAEGIAEFTGLEYGEYFIREKKPIAGYALNSTVREAKIYSYYKELDITVYNRREFGSLTLWKFGTDSKKQIGKGALFKLYRKIDKGSIVKTEQVNLYFNKKENRYEELVLKDQLENPSDAESVNNILDIGKSGESEISVRVNRLSSSLLGEKVSYYFEEIKAPEGYKLPVNPKSSEVELDNDKNNTKLINMYNEPIEKYNILVTKVDSTTNKAITDATKLQNAEFRLKDPDGKDVYITKVSDGVYKKDSSYNYTMKLSNEGKLKIQDLDKKGKYTLTEVKAPTGYQLSNTPLVCDVVNKDNSFTFKNTQIPKDGIVRITKKDLRTGDVLSGVVFELLDSTKQVVKTATTNSQGIAEFTGLKYGNYYVREKSTKAGYILKTDLEQARITSTYKIEKLTIYNEKELYNLSVTKVDSKTGKAIVDSEKLKNAEFRLKDPDGKDVYITKVSDGVYKKDSSYNYTMKLSNEGKLKIQDLDKKGKYTLTEVKAPTGYQLSNTPLVCDVVNKDNSFTFKNTQIPKDGSVTIIKKDSKNQKVLSGVTFELLDKDKRLITTSKTGSTGIAGFSNLEYGKYYIREKETISGYKLDSRLHEVNISNAKKSIALSLYNEPIEKTIKVIKKDNNGELLKDAEFTLFKKDGSKLTKVESKVTNTKGEIEFSNLRIGQYVLRETKAPNGFRPYSEDMEIDLTKQVSPVYTVTLNNYKVEENIPSTGTRGATMFLASGLGIIMLAYIFKKRKIFA